VPTPKTAAAWAATIRGMKFSLVAAPLFLLGYGVIRLVGRADGRYGPGLDWQAAHLANLVSLGLFAVVVLGMRRLLPRGPWREVVVGGTLLGIGALTGQFVNDTVAAMLAHDRAEMVSIGDRFQAVPGVMPVFYTVGPQLFGIGLFVLTVLLARAGRLPWWSAALTVAGVLVPAFTLDLLPVSGLALLAAYAPLWSGRRTAGPRPVR
jgi:hypothetical protein